MEDRFDNLLMAGSADLLATDKNGDYVLFDWKRSKHALTPDQTPFKNSKGLGLCAHVPDTHFYKYSLQLACYNVMLRRTQGVDCGDRMFIVNVHPNNAEAVQAKAADLRSIAERIVDERIEQSEPASKRQRA